jgi:RNA polymerase-binding transcription factor DksA
MADAADRAQRVIEQTLDDAFKSQREAVRRSSDCCIECDLLIPSERQVALGGTELCADCATILELKGRR